MDANDLLEFERLKHRIEILTEKIENVGLKAGHAEATVVSERRQWDRLAADYKELTKDVTEICEELDKYNKILFNSGQGMILDVDRLKKWKESEDKREDKRLTFWIGIGGIIIGVISIAMQIINKT